MSSCRRMSSGTRQLPNLAIIPNLQQISIKLIKKLHQQSQTLTDQHFMNYLSLNRQRLGAESITIIQLMFYNSIQFILLQSTVMVKIIDNYTMTTYLGKGQYGKVYQAFHIDTRIDVAIKMIDLEKFQTNSKLAQLTKNQLQTLKLLQNNINVVKFVEMIKSANYIYLVYEYCQGGTLEDLMRIKGPLPEKEGLAIFRQLINAFKSLHEHHILHRDIKPNNIFFKSGHLKLADFGFCKKLKSSDDFTQTSLGSPLYMAPEILNGDVYGSKADVWSCGIVLYEMLFGYCPYGHCNIKQMLDIYNEERGGVLIPSDKFSINPVTEMMLRRMLQKDQFRRISWQDFLYEYDITPQGVLHKKEKDFQYDLMKLMKKNSSLTANKQKPAPIKFDWSKITERSSSVHSQEISPMTGSEETGLDEMLQVKRKIKEMQGQHRKMLEITLVLQSLLDSEEEHRYSNAIIYFLVHTLSVLVTRNVTKINLFTQEKQDFLAKNENQAKALHKLQVVFKNQATALTTKANSIKVSLLQCANIEKEVFKFPAKPVLRKYLKEYIQLFEETFQGVTALNNEGIRDETAFLLKVVWSISQIQQDKNLRDLDDNLSIKPQHSKFELAIQLNKYLVALGV